MGLFENLGKKVERFKQQAQQTADEEADYVCEDCGELVYGHREECPHCGSESVVEREPTDVGDERKNADRDEK